MGRRILPALGAGVLLSVVGAVVALGQLFGEGILPGDSGGAPPADARAARGTLLVSTYGDGDAAAPLTHETVYVSGRHYAGMEDNDLRGFLDGRFQYGWNQASQIHVRVGRKGHNPVFGEHELFRVLHRWDDLGLPPGTEIVDARLEVAVEFGPDFPVDVYLYEVKQDWNPGQGGLEGNNNSPPAPGEVWWAEAAHRERPWGLPGAGFASDSHPGADTAASALAHARYTPGARYGPGTDVLRFASPALTAYVDARAAQGRPLLFLIKLSDVHEDVPGSRIGLYSADHGDDRNPARRPRLVVEWRSPAEESRLVSDLLLEPGRGVVLGPLPLDGARTVAASFAPVEGYDAPTIEVRSLGPDGPTPWRPAPHPVAVAGEALEVRVRAVVDPVPLGEAFVATLRDTWVETGPPEQQDVVWTFESPTGQSHTVRADYEGDHRWRARFVPAEPGRWRYSWTQRFTAEPYRSAVGAFDVVPDGADAVRERLLALRDEIAASPLPPGEARVEAFGPLFMRLERAALALQTPEGYAAPAGRDLAELLSGVRALLVGYAAPEPDSLSSEAGS